jgi:hypothetical protein
MIPIFHNYKVIDLTQFAAWRNAQRIEVDFVQKNSDFIDILWITLLKWLDAVVLY